MISGYAEKCPVDFHHSACSISVPSENLDRKLHRHSQACPILEIVMQFGLVYGVTIDFGLIQIVETGECLYRYLQKRQGVDIHQENFLLFWSSHLLETGVRGQMCSQ